jgi:quercetin dioxygenase-like cupin family protein
MSKHNTRVNPSEEAIQMGASGIGIRFLLTREDTNGTMSVFEVRVPAGQKLTAPAHKNDAYEEVLYGIEGVLTWTVDGTPIEVGPGQALCIPRGSVHRFDNFGSVDVKQLCLISPPVMGPGYFREAAEAIGAAAGGPPDRAKMSEIFQRHGMTVAAPPPGK